MLTAGQIHDLACAQDLIENADLEALIADKAYDADALIDGLAEREITPVIPPKANRKVKRDCDFALYCERNLIARQAVLCRHREVGDPTTGARRQVARRFTVCHQDGCMMP